MTTVVPKLSKSDAVPFKASQSARAAENTSASFARALKDADAAKTAVRRASEVAENSVRLRTQTSDSGGSADSGDDSVLNGPGPAQSRDLESASRDFGDSGEALAVDSANIAGPAAQFLNAAGTSTALNANHSLDGGVLTTEVAGVMASGAVAKAVELAQAAALWANGGLKDGSGASMTNLGVDSSSLTDAGELSGPAVASGPAVTSAESAPSTLANLLSKSQGSTIPGVMDPAGFATPGGGIGAASLESSAVDAAGSFVAPASLSSGLVGVPSGLSGASASLRGAFAGSGQSAATNALLNAGRSEASGPGVTAPGALSASIAHSGVVSVASALAAASSVRSAQSSALSDSGGLSTTAGSLTGILSVPMMSGSAGADLGGSTLGSQTGGAGSESDASSGGARSGNSNAFAAQAANSSEPQGMAPLPGGVDAPAGLSRVVGLASYANATEAEAEAEVAIARVTTKATSDVDVDVNRPPALDANTPEIQASVAADPRSAWRDLRSRWDQPIRANAPKA